MSKGIMTGTTFSPVPEMDAKSHTMIRNLHLHIEADHENRRHPYTEPLCDATFRDPSKIPLHVLKQHGRKDVIIFPSKYGLEVSELATASLCRWLKPSKGTR
jgi:hypothetical protein